MVCVRDVCNLVASTVQAIEVLRRWLICMACGIACVDCMCMWMHVHVHVLPAHHNPCMRHDLGSSPPDGRCAWIVLGTHTVCDFIYNDEIFP